MKIKNVLIIGGTHGNEWTGAYIVLKYSQLIKKQFPELNIFFEFGNPEAFKANLRFIKYDLNRIFNSITSHKHLSEASRAKYLKKRISELSPCLVIDLHTTTANMGSSIIITNENRDNLKILSCMKNLHFVASADKEKKLLISQTKHGFIIEVGPVHQNVIDIRAIKRTLGIIGQILKAITGQLKPKNNYIYLYKEIRSIYYPTDSSGEIEAALHEKFLAQDFRKQLKNFIPFRKFTGELMPIKTNERFYPIFINECSYYKEKLAFILCRKTKIFTHRKRKDASRG